MRVAFDVRSEFHQLLSHVGWKQLSQHWIAVELLRGYRSLLSAPGYVWRGFNVAKMIRGTWRRVTWVLPRPPAGLVRRLGGFLLLCAFIGVGMKMWPRDGETATAAVPSSLSSTASSGQVGPPAQGPSAPRPVVQGPPLKAQKPAPIDVQAQRKADLVKAQQACLARLQDTEEYQAAKARFDDVDVRVRALRSKDPYRELPKLSIEWIEAKSDLQKVIDQAMKADPDVVRAQASIRQPRRFR